MNDITAKVIEKFDKNVALIKSMKSLDKRPKPMNEATVNKIKASIEDLDGVFADAVAADAGFVNGKTLGFYRRVCVWILDDESIHSDPDYVELLNAVSNAVKTAFKFTE